MLAQLREKRIGRGPAKKPCKAGHFGITARQGMGLRIAKHLEPMFKTAQAKIALAERLRLIIVNPVFASQRNKRG